MEIINYIGILSAIAMLLEYIISEKKGEALALKLIDWSSFLSTKNIDKLVSNIALYFSAKYDKVYGAKYFGKREWILSAAITFAYCVLLSLAEKSIGFSSNLSRQLFFWFLPNLTADIISINFTRWLLKKLYSKPEKYLQYLVYDVLIFLLCFYICFSFTIMYLSIFSEHSFMRGLLHPLFLFQTMVQHFPDPMALDALFILLIASTTFIPTLLHILFVAAALVFKVILPLLCVFINNLIEKMISFERHPIGVAVVVTGLFLLPFLILFDLLIV
ncbi:MAG: hypothetical protein K9K82_03190 [Desulfobacteraceae bacterium]|nr:hypothetical protein [Desulfobacteraceae bacterium]